MVVRAGGGVLKGHGCPGHSIMGAAISTVETARVDGSMSTFLLVHSFLAVLTIGGPAHALQLVLCLLASTQRHACRALSLARSQSCSRHQH